MNGSVKVRRLPALAPGDLVPEVRPLQAFGHERPHEVSQPTPRDRGRERPIGQILHESGLISSEEVDRILCHARASGIRFGEAAVALGLVRPTDLKMVLAYQFNLDLVRDGECHIDREVIAAHESFHPVLDDLRALRDQLLLRWHAQQAPGVATLAVLGTQRGDGRSFTAANLAVTFAQVGLNVLLIDADLRHGRLHRMFGVDGSLGLSSVLSGRNARSAEVPVDGVKGLSLLACGGEPPNIADLMVGERFIALLRESAASHDLVLLDTSAAASAPEALSIAARATGTLLVARRGETRVGALQTLAQQVRDVGGTSVGAVFAGA